jgi:hypothetical protein
MDGSQQETGSSSFPNFIVGTHEYSRDTFGRLVTTTPTTIFTTDTQFTAQKQNIDFVSTGTGLITVDVSNSIISLSASGSGGRAVRQSREYLLYQPGKPQVATFTFVPNYSGTFDSSVAIRAGLFDDYRDKNTGGSTYPGAGVEVNQPSMGHFFEISGNQLFVVERANSPNNILNVNRIPQNNWNVDTLNGDRSRSPSGYTLPVLPLNPCIVFIERQWLGLGSVRMGVIINGRPIICHSFQNRNLGRPYTHLSKLPVRWEIEKVAGGSANTATMASICAVVQVMGTYTTFGPIFSIPMSIAGTQVTVDTTVRPIVAIRLQQQYCRATIKLKSVEIMNSDTQVNTRLSSGFTVYKNPTISGAAFTWVKHPDSNSMIEYYYFPTYTTSAYTLSGGIPTLSAFITEGVTVQDSLTIEELITATSYCSDIKGNSDILVVGAKAISSTTPLVVNLVWIELT